MRTWKPLSRKHLATVVKDTEQDSGGGTSYCPDDVYRMAQELTRARRELAGLRHACLAAIGFLGGQSVLSKRQLVKELADAVRDYATGVVPG